MEDADQDDVLQDVKSAIDRIPTLPEEAERPQISKMVNRSEVLTVVVHGDQNMKTLRAQAERIRDDLLATGKITQVDIGGVPNYEISVEVPEHSLRSHHLSLAEIAGKIRASAKDLPGGSIKASGGQIMLRSKARRTRAAEFSDIVVSQSKSGSLVHLSDIASIRDRFQDTDLSATFNGQPAALVKIFRVGNQSPSGISKVAKDYMARRKPDLAGKISLSIWNDYSEMLRGRMQLLGKNAGLGLLLVIIVLTLFLETKLAFWVTMGIPISVFGAFIIMTFFGVTINMITLFAFILVLGIVVDDAIVVGENAYTHLSEGKPPLLAAGDGASEVGKPVTFSIMTTIAAFSPLAFVSGIMGKFLGPIAVIVISVLSMSLAESLLVLPSHLSHIKVDDPNRPTKNPLKRLQRICNSGMNAFIHGPFARVTAIILRHRYIVTAISVAMLMLTIGLIKSGRMKFVFLPEVEGDLVRAQLTMPFGIPVNETNSYLDQIVDAAKDTIKEFDAGFDGNPDHPDNHSDEMPTNLRGVLRSTGSFLPDGGPVNIGGSGGGHIGEVAVYLKPPEQRVVDPGEFKKRWRERVGAIPGSESLKFETRMSQTGSPIGIELSHKDNSILQTVTMKLKAHLAGYPGVFDIKDSDDEGKRELQIRIKPEASALGLSDQNIGAQVRSAYYGAEALRFQRDRSEIKVMVRYPESERTTLGGLTNMRLTTPDNHHYCRRKYKQSNAI